MEMRPVSSAHIAAIGYENGVLAVRFHSGGLYHYHDVPAATVEGLRRSDSVGAAFRQTIKGHYRERRIE